MNDAFNTGANDAAGIINQLGQFIASAVQQMAQTFAQIAPAMNDAFKAGANAAAGYIDALRSFIASATTAMVSSLNNVVTALKNIGTAANTAKSAVDALRAAVEALPNIQRTITYTIRTVGTVPAGGSLAHGGIVTGKAVVAGEMGRPEMVKISRAASGTITTGGASAFAGFGGAIATAGGIVANATLFPLGKKQKIKVAPGTVKFPEDRLMDMHRRDIQKKFASAVSGGQKTEIIILQVDGKELTRIVRKNLMNDTGGYY